LYGNLRPTAAPSVSLSPTAVPTISTYIYIHIYSTTPSNALLTHN
jgi:hypothetical protein